MAIPSIDTLLADIAKRTMMPVGVCKRRIPFGEPLAEELQMEIDTQIIGDIMKALPPEEKSKLILPPDMEAQRKASFAALEKARNEQIKNLPRVYSARSGVRKIVTVWDHMGKKSRRLLDSQFNTKYTVVLEPAKDVIREKAALFGFTFLVRRTEGRPVGIAKSSEFGDLRPYSVGTDDWVDVWTGPRLADHGTLPPDVFKQRFDVVFTPEEIEETYLNDSIDK